MVDSVGDMLEVMERPLAELPDPLPLPPPSALPAMPIAHRVRPPGSKSLTNRALLLAALSDGASELGGPLLGADDTERMMEALASLGAACERGEDTVRVRGVGGRWKTPKDGLEINLKNAGTATRFLTAASMLAGGPITIDGNERMRERPIGELVGALRSLGAAVDFVGANDGCPPVRVTPPAPRSIPATVALKGKLKSSQFVSALALLGPFMPDGITIKLDRDPPSSAYIEMTLELLEQAGANVQTAAELRFIRVTPGEDRGGKPGLNAFALDIEPDASGATYWWGAAALGAGRAITVDGLNSRSLQSDADFAMLLGRMGPEVDYQDDGVTVVGSERLSALLADMTQMPDAAMTLGSVCAFAEGNSVLRGLETLRVKETDRIAAMQNELGKLGVIVETPVAGDEGAITITPPSRGIDCSDNAPPIAFDTYDDHRMAMSTALIALRRPNVFINDPGCVAKTYPGFWKAFAQLWKPADERP